MLQALTTRERAPRFDDVLHPGFRAWTPGLAFEPWCPAAGFHDDPERLVLRVDLPGVAAADLDLQIEPRGLSIQAIRRRGDRSRTYAQHWSFACAVDAERATATLEDGVLTVVLPKVPPRRIPIRAAGRQASSSPGALDRLRDWIRSLFPSSSSSPGAGARGRES